MRLSCALSSPFASFPHPGYSRSTKWAFVLVFLFVWVINERLRTASDLTYHADIFAVQATAIEFVKLALSLVYFYWTRRSQGRWLHSSKTNRYTSVPDEEEQALSDLNDSLEEEFVDVPRREENGHAQTQHTPDRSFHTAVSVILTLLAGFLFTYLRHTSSLLEMLTDPFTFYLGYPVSVLFTFLTSFFILSRTFDGLQWQSALLQFCGLLAIQASLIPTPIAEYSYPFLMGFALAGSCSLLIMDFIYTHSHNISLELIHVILFASSWLISTVAFGSQHPVQSTIQTHVATFTIWDGAYVLTQTILDLLTLTTIFYFEAATAATLVSFGAAIHLLSVSLNPATHTFALAAGSTIAVIASVTHVAQAKRSDEKRGQHFLLNVLGALFVIVSAVYVAVGSYQVYPTVSSYTSRPTTVTDIVAASKVTCPRKPLQSLSFFPHQRQYHAFDNILLIVFFSHARYDANLDYYKEVYSEFFPNIVFVGPGSREDAGFSHSYDVLVDSYESDEDLSDPSFYKMAGRMAHHMLYTAMREYDCYDGYLWAPFDTLLNIPRLQQFDQNNFWYHSPFGQYVPNAAWGDEVTNQNASRHPPPLNISPDPSLNLTEGWRGWGPDWWWGEPHVGVEVCMRAFRKVPEEMREHLAQKTNGTRLLGGSADTLYIPGRHRQAFLDVLGLFLETDCFLEIATPTAVHLVVPPEEPPQAGPSWLAPNQHVWLRRSVTPLAVLQEDGLTIAAHYGAEYCPPNVSYYPTAVDPSEPWTGSPKSQPFVLDDPGKDRYHWPQRVLPTMERWRAHGFCPRPGAVSKEKMLKLRSSKLSISYWKDAIRMYWDKKACKRVEKDWPGLHGVKRVPLPTDWKQYGYWARPHFPHDRPERKHDHVSNSTPPSSPIELSKEDVEKMVESLHDPDGSFHPSRWVARSEHPMLPKRPDLWPTPHASLENLTYKTPSELILNPLLEHRKLGRPPILFDLRMGLENILIGGHEGHDWLNPHLGANSSNAYQPATYPGVSAMSINLLAEDTRTTFTWKCTVLPHHPSLPVMVIDVLHAIKENFDQNIYDAECATIVGERRNQMWYAFEQRIKLIRAKRLNALKRVDYLGDHYYFRGLEPAPDDEGWMIYFGAP